MADIGGYMGKILRVDLSAGRLWDEVLDETTLRQWIGGTGIGVKIVYDEVPPGVEWDSPENRLVLAAGPFGGTRTPASGTYSVTTKGALVNGMVCTQANGFLGARLKFAGYDAVVVQGIAPKWTYIYLHDGIAELRDASHLVGKDSFETEDALVKETGVKQTSIACVGQAGENKVRFACICSDKGHIAASGGAGAVMGAKRLKAIVAHGKATVPIKEKARFSGLTKQFLESAKTYPLATMVASVGTLGMAQGKDAIGRLPVKNWTEDVFPEATRYGVEIFRPAYKSKAHPCWACQLAHCQEYTIPDGKYAGLKVEEPEAEGFAAFSPLIGVADPPATLYINQLVDRLGMDLKEGGFTVSMAMECYVKGLLTKEQTDGLDLSWGNADDVIALLNKIAHREGWLGNILAEGVMRGAQAIGGDAPKFAIHFGKGNAPHTHESRSLAYHMFGQSVSDMGSLVGDSMAIDPDLGFPEAVPPYDPDALTAFMAKTAPRRQFEDTLGCCKFLLGGRMSIIADTLSAVTGWTINMDDCLEVGERIVHLQRAFNLRHGKTPDDDSLSPRMQEGPREGVPWVSIAPHYERMKRGYYEQRGWDPKTSRPLPATLRRYGLDKVVRDLWES